MVFGRYSHPASLHYMQGFVNHSVFFFYRSPFGRIFFFPPMPLHIIPRLVAPFSLIIPFSHSPPMLALSVVPSLHLFMRATGRAGFQFIYLPPLRSGFFKGFHFRTPPAFQPPDAVCYHHRRGQPSTRADAPSIRMPSLSHSIGTQIPLLPLFFGKFTVRLFKVVENRTKIIFEGCVYMVDI